MDIVVSGSVVPCRKAYAYVFALEAVGGAGNKGDQDTVGAGQWVAEAIIRPCLLLINIFSVWSEVHTANRGNSDNVNV